MPRLLLISYFFAPEPTPGALRAGAIAKFLPEHGWTVDLVTRTRPSRPPDGRTLVTPHKPWIEWLQNDLRIQPARWFKAPPGEFKAADFIPKPSGLRAKAWNLFRKSGLQAATWPDRSFGWTRWVQPAFDDFVREHRPDAILSTSPPETTHFLGRRAHRISGAPWIADLRDPWSDTELMDRPRWRTRLDTWTEKHILASAAVLTTVSAPIAEDLELLHPAKLIRAILNGFDPDDFFGEVPVDRKRFTIVYTGSITFGRHDVVTFLEGARRFLDQHPAAPLSIHFLGENSPLLQGQVQRFGLEAVTRCEARGAHGDAVAAMRAAPVILFLPWQDPAHAGVYSAKLFEYLGARRPILAVGAIPGVAGALLHETGAGRMGHDLVETAGLLARLYQAHMAGEDAWIPTESAVLRYSHREMVRQFADELDRAMHRKEH